MCVCVMSCVLCVRFVFVLVEGACVFCWDGLCDVAWCVVVLCLCVFRLMSLCVVSVDYCVMLYDLSVLCDCCVFVRVLCHVFVGCRL